MLLKQETSIAMVAYNKTENDSGMPIEDARMDREVCLVRSSVLLMVVGSGSCSDMVFVRVDATWKTTGKRGFEGLVQRTTCPRGQVIYGPISAENSL